MITECPYQSKWDDHENCILLEGHEGTHRFKPLRLETTDAVEWAEAFCAIHGGDVELMITWFANAIETGREAGLRER